MVPDAGLASSMMSYTFTVRVHQPSDDWFKVVESTVWYYAGGGTWSQIDGQQVLEIGGSGTSGTLRFANSKEDYFIIAIGVHNYKPWTDIVTDLESKNTGVEMHPTYYSEGKGSRSDRLWAQALETIKVSSKGIKCRLTVSGSDHDLIANLHIF